MGKLGKKARKFAKKHLQSVLRRRRKTKALFRKKYSLKNEQEASVDEVHDDIELPKGRNRYGENIEDSFLDAIVTDESDGAGDASDSDGYLSEDSNCQYVLEKVDEIKLAENSGTITLSRRNRKIHEEVFVQKKKLERLKKKDPEFIVFLESYNKGRETKQDEEYSDGDERSDHGMQLGDGDNSGANKGKVLTSFVINSWCQLAMKEHSESAVVSLLNAYRAACHYGTESFDSIIQNNEDFCNILMFMLHEADTIFRKLLKISSSKCKKETILELKSTAKWEKLKPLIKSYLRSTLFLLSQITDSEILAFSLYRLRASLIFFAAFPYLLSRLVKITVHLWATSQEGLSSSSFLVIRDVAIMFGSNFFDICLTKTFKAFITQCRVSEVVDIKHIHFLRDCFVDLCSLDLQKSYGKALSSIQQLAKILHLGLRTKHKEAVKKMCSWEYINCVDMWIMFISANIRDFDLQPLLYMMIQLINGVAYMFPGPRYFPLRVKCIQWINNLSCSSGIFIPVASLVLDVLEYKIGKDAVKTGNTFSFPSSLKLPKNLLKLENFQEQCVSCVVELLSGHFAQWSHHISFPELATIPLLHLRKYYESTTIESLRRLVKRLIDQVEQNVDFVQRKRDEVAFSPKDHPSVELFLQNEKCNSNAPFTQYYRSVSEKAAVRSLHKNESMSSLRKKNSNRKRGLPDNMVDASVNIDSEKSSLQANGGKMDGKGKRRRTLEA